MESDVCVICLEGEGQLFKFCRCCYLAHLNCLQSYINYEADGIKKCACGRKIDARVLQKLLRKERKINITKIVTSLVLVIFATILATLLICEIAKSNERIKSFCEWIYYFCITSFYACSTILCEIVYFSIFIANWVNITLFPIIWNCVISAIDCMCIGYSTISKCAIVVSKEANNIFCIYYPFITEWVVFISRLITNWFIYFFQTVLTLLKNNSTYLLEIAQFVLESLIYTLQNIVKLILSASKYSIDFVIIYGPIMHDSLSSLILNFLDCCRYVITFTAHCVVTYSPVVYEYLSSLFLFIINWLIESTQNVYCCVLTNGPKAYDSMSTFTLLLVNNVWEISVNISTWVQEASQSVGALIFVIGEITLKYFYYIGEVFRIIFIDTAPIIVEYFIDFCQYIYNKLSLLYQIVQHYFVECTLMSGKILNYIYTAFSILTRTMNHLIEEYCTVLMKYFYVILDYFILFGTQIMLIVSSVMQMVYFIVFTLCSYILLFLKHSLNYAHSITEILVNYFSILLLKIGYILYHCGQIFGLWMLSITKITFDLIITASPPLLEWILLSLQLIYFWLVSIINVSFNCVYIVFKNTLSSIIYICDIATSDEVFSSKVLDLCYHITSKWLISIGQVITDWMISIIHISWNFVFTVIQFTYTTLTNIILITFNWLQLLLEISVKHFPIDWF